ARARARRSARAPSPFARARGPLARPSRNLGRTRGSEARPANAVDPPQTAVRVAQTVASRGRRRDAAFVQAGRPAARAPRGAVLGVRLGPAGPSPAAALTNAHVRPAAPAECDRARPPGPLPRPRRGRRLP